MILWQKKIIYKCVISCVMSFNFLVFMQIIVFLCLSHSISVYFHYYTLTILRYRLFFNKFTHTLTQHWTSYSDNEYESLYLRDVHVSNLFFIKCLLLLILAHTVFPEMWATIQFFLKFWNNNISRYILGRKIVDREGEALVEGDCVCVCVCSLHITFWMFYET